MWKNNTKETVQSIIPFSPKCSALPNTSYLQAFAEGEQMIRKSLLSRGDKIRQYSCEWKISVIPHVLGGRLPAESQWADLQLRLPGNATSYGRSKAQAHDFSAQVVHSKEAMWWNLSIKGASWLAIVARLQHRSPEGRSVLILNHAGGRFICKTHFLYRKSHLSRRHGCLSSNWPIVQKTTTNKQTGNTCCERSCRKPGGSFSSGCEQKKNGGHQWGSSPTSFPKRTNKQEERHLFSYQTLNRLKKQED